MTERFALGVFRVPAPAVALALLMTIAAAPLRAALPNLGSCPACANGGLAGMDGGGYDPALASSGGAPKTAAAPAPISTPEPTPTPVRTVSAPAVAPAAESAPKAAPALALATTPEGWLRADFAVLAGFAYAPPERAGDPLAGVPPSIRALDGKTVVASGFMLPFRMEGARCRQFLLLRNQMACCFGVPPGPNEWIVANSAKGVPINQDTPVTVVGTLRVGAKFDGEAFAGLYELEVDDARAP